jgi:glycosyltransferase involved in cell wall biosynthesis
LFLTESFHPVMGGGEGHIRALGRALAATGVPCTVLTRRGDALWPAAEELDGVRVIRVGPPGPARLGKYLMVPAVCAALVRERSRFDVLVVRGTRVLGMPGLLVARLLGKAVVLQAEINGEMSGEAYVWGTRFATGPGRGLVRGAVALRNLFFRDADAFVAMSRAIRGEFLAAGVARERTVHLPHGVDTARYRPAGADEKQALRRQLGLPASCVIFGYTGRLLRGKGLEALLEAFAELATGAPEAHLVLVGSGEGQALSVDAELRAEVERRSLGSRVTFAGRVDEVEAWLRAMDVFVFPSLYEALGISLIEAASTGLPSVASRTGGIVDVVRDGETGLLVEPGRVSDLLSAMRALLQDAPRRSALGRAAREDAVQRFAFGATVTRYRCLFAEAGR